MNQCVGVILTVLAAVALAADHPPGTQKPADPDVTFTIPEGWRRVDRDRVIVLMPEGVTPLECAVVISPADTIGDDGFDKWFQAKWDALRQGGKVTQGGTRQRKDGPNGSSVLVETALVESGGGEAGKKTMGLMLYAVRISDAAHYAVFKTDGAAKFNEHKKTVNQLLGSVKFSETTVVETPPEPKKPVKRAPIKRPPGGAGSRN